MIQNYSQITLCRRIRKFYLDLYCRLKNPMKKVAGNMNEDELDSFLKDMVGGHEIPFDETMRQAIKDLKNDAPVVNFHFCFFIRITFLNTFYDYAFRFQNHL